jgi:hypothetical protein
MKSMVKPQPEDTRTEYQRFEDLTRQLLTVSKEELDKRQAEYERKKKRKKRMKK